MIQFTIENCYTIINDTAIHPIIKDFCRIQYQYFFKTKKMRKAKSAFKTVDFCIEKDNRIMFPTGWLGSITRSLREQSIPFVCKDNRKKPLRTPLSDAKILSPRRHQVEAVEVSVRIGRGILQHATGSGKTYLAGMLYAYFGRATLFIVPTIQLMNQHYKEFSELFSAYTKNAENFIGRVGGGYTTIGHVTLVVASSLKRYMTDMYMRHDPKLVIWDEGHHLNLGPDLMQNNWLKYALQLDSCYWRFSLTGTPGKEGTIQRKALEMATGRILHVYDSQEGIKDGHLVPPRIRFLKVTHGDKSNLPWSRARQDLCQHVFRNKVICQEAMQRLKSGKKTLILVDLVEQHGRVLAKLLGKYAHFVHKDTPHEKREKLLRDFKNKGDFILMGTIFGEGINIPDLDTVIRAGGGKSDKKMQQNIGRVLRRVAGKETAELIDFYDEDYVIIDQYRCTVCKYWIPKKNTEVTCPRCGGEINIQKRRFSGYLLKHSQQRVKTFRELGFSVEII